MSKSTELYSDKKMKNLIFLLLITSLISGCNNPNSSSSSGSSGSLGYDHTFLVSSLTPSDGATDVSRTVSISITFNRAVNPDSVDANYVDTTCRGAIQAYAVGSSTCVQWSASPVASNGNKTFTVTPKYYLIKNTEHHSNQ